MILHPISRMKIIELINELKERVDPKNEYMRESVDQAKNDLLVFERLGFNTNEKDCDK